LVSSPTSSSLDAVVQRFIEDAGRLTQSLGFGRVIGQIYAFLYFSRRPRCLSDLEHGLGISKGSASMGVRQLEQWSAVSKVWIKGDRKDYYEANDWFGQILKNALVDTIGKKMTASTALVGALESEVAALPNGDGDRAFILDRIEHVKQFNNKVYKLWNSPTMKMLLGQ